MNRFMPFALTKNKKSTLISALIFLLCFAYLPGKINPLGSHVSARSIWDATLDVADARGLTNSTTSAAPQEGGAIAGTIRMFNGQIPDRGTIEIFLPQPDGTQNLVSEIRFDSLTEPDVVNPESGAYEIQDLAPGSYIVWVTANRYFEIYDNADSANPTLVTVVDGQVTGDINFIMDENPNKGLIAGRVTNTNGEPLPLIAIDVYDLDDTLFSKSLETDGNGEFRISALRPGRYQVGFFDTSENLYVSEYYDNYSTIDPSRRDGAQHFTITSNESYTDVNPVLDLGGVISGTVLLADGSIDESQKRITAYYDNNGVWEFTSRTYFTSDYQLTGLSAGTHTLQLEQDDSTLEYYGNVASIEEAVAINVYPYTTVPNLNFVIGLDDEAVFPKPVAAFAVQAITGSQENFTVTFQDRTIGVVDTWAWDFGDGGTSAEQNATHEFTAAGVYTVTLTASGAGGTSTVTKQVQGVQKIFLPAVVK